MSYTITDENTDEVVTVEASADVVDAIRPWFREEPPADVVAAFDELHTNLMWHRDTSGAEVFLGIRIERT